MKEYNYIGCCDSIYKDERESLRNYNYKKYLQQKTEDEKNRKLNVLEGQFLSEIANVHPNYLDNPKTALAINDVFNFLKKSTYYVC